MVSLSNHASSAFKCRFHRLFSRATLLKPFHAALLTADSPVDRRTYFTVGARLALLKYAGDASLIWLATGRLWTPANYLSSMYFLWDAIWVQAPSWLLPVLTVWTFPFLWIGVLMTRRRCEDAGLSAWAALGFFVPYANYLLMLTLSVMPSAAAHPARLAEAEPAGERLSSALLAMAIATAAGLAGVFLSVELFRSYGVALFFGTPFIVGAVGAFIFNRRYPASLSDTFGITFLTFVMAALVLVVVAREGVVCLLMAVPLVLPVALLGAALGRSTARQHGGPTSLALFSLLLVPVTVSLEPAHVSGRTLHEVQTAVVIDRPPDRVWTHVIAFQPISEPLELTFRVGIASPQYARIEGTGVGAVRYCFFSTGAFVEPITGWEPGRRLAFDVTSSPAPLRELSLYAGVQPPHLDGYLRSRRGEFRLVPLPGGRTRLEGSTWYEIEMAPEGYWQLFSDYLIHQVHRRVLDHIKREVETGV